MSRSIDSFGYIEWLISYQRLRGEFKLCLSRPSQATTIILCSFPMSDSNLAAYDKLNETIAT
jgi:hypothetical protein